MIRAKRTARPREKRARIKGSCLRHQSQLDFPRNKENKPFPTEIGRMVLEIYIPREFTHTIHTPTRTHTSMHVWFGFIYYIRLFLILLHLCFFQIGQGPRTDHQ